MTSTRGGEGGWILFSFLSSLLFFVWKIEKVHNIISPVCFYFLTFKVIRKFCYSTHNWVYLIWSIEKWVNGVMCEGYHQNKMKCTNKNFSLIIGSVWGLKIGRNIVTSDAITRRFVHFSRDVLKSGAVGDDTAIYVRL